MIACTDVDYRENPAWTGILLFDHWGDEHPVWERVDACQWAGDYRSGQFFRRELPPLLQALGRLHQMPQVVIVAGYCWLGPEVPGLGAHLHVRLQGPAVVGVAKSPYRSWPGLPNLRGQSSAPLYITACAFDEEEAGRAVQRMHGAFRIPTLLRRVDQLARGRLTGGNSV